MTSTLAWLPIAFWTPGPMEMALIGVIALLLYGGDLPQVAKSWGKTFAEFRRSLSGIQSEINDAIYSEPATSPQRLEYHPEFHNDQSDDADTGGDPSYEDAVSGTVDENDSAAEDPPSADADRPRPDAD